MRRSLAAVLCYAAMVCDGFAVRRTLTMKRRLLSEGKKKKNKARKVTLTKVPGITPPENGKLKGWSLDVGEGSVQFCAATLNERLFVLERDCSCCGWELDKGDLRGSAAADPAVACCLCGQTYNLVTDCVEINQCVGCTRQFFTKSFLGDDASVLARSRGEEPAPPRHRAGVASMAWRTTR